VLLVLPGQNERKLLLEPAVILRHYSIQVSLPPSHCGFEHFCGGLDIQLVCPQEFYQEIISAVEREHGVLLHEWTELVWKN
jgi:hypothetical protein